MSSKSGSTPSGRDAKLEAIRRQNEADKRRSRIIAIVTGAVVVALVGAIAIVIAIAARQETVQASAAPAGLVTVQNADGKAVEGVALGPADSEVTVTIFEDFLCPVCRQFEQSFGTYVDGLPDDGVRVVYSPIAFLDRLSKGTEYSTRSNSAAMCLADTDGPDIFKAYKKLLFANQPTENTEGLTNEALRDLAAQAGASEEALQCVVDEGFTGWAGRNTKAAQDAGVQGTPTVWVNGTRVGPDRGVATQSDIQAAIDAIRGGASGGASTGASDGASATPSE